MKNTTQDNNQRTPRLEEKNRRDGQQSHASGPNSLVAFLRAIKFRKNACAQDRAVDERTFARPHPQARQGRPLAEEASCVRSAN
ncbi:MAG: hypothetical protein ACI87W_001078 [Halieaceae bacterium]|jgi:hypothetical protein